MSVITLNIEDATEACEAFVCRYGDDTRSRCTTCRDIPTFDSVCECGLSPHELREIDDARERRTIADAYSLAIMALEEAANTSCDYCHQMPDVCTCEHVEPMEGDDPVGEALAIGVLIDTFADGIRGQDAAAHAPVMTLADVKARYLTGGSVPLSYQKMMAPAPEYGGPTPERPGYEIAQAATDETPEVRLQFVERITLHGTTPDARVKDSTKPAGFRTEHRFVNPYLRNPELTSEQRRDRQMQSQVVVYQKQEIDSETGKITPVSFGLAWFDAVKASHSSGWLPGSDFWTVEYVFTRRLPAVELDGTWRDDLTEYNAQYLTPDAAKEAEALRIADRIGTAKDF